MEWINCSERMPETKQHVALLDVNTWMNTGCDNFDCNWAGAGYLTAIGGATFWEVHGVPRGRNKESVTHWMPLPDAPTE